MAKNTIAIDIETAFGFCSHFYFAYTAPSREIKQGFGVASNFSFPSRKAAKAFLDNNWVQLTKLLPDKNVGGFFYIITQKRGQS